MASHIPNNPLVVKAALIFKRDTRTFVNTLHFSDSTGWDSTKMQALAADLVDWWHTSYRTAMGVAVTLVQVQVRLLDPANPLAVDYTIGLPEGGAIIEGLEAANVTSTMSWRTGLAGRKYRGRIYVPAITEGQTNQDDTLTSTMAARLATVATYFLTHLIAGTRFPTIFHLGPDTFTNITTFVIENILDSQRRRLPGRGR